MTRSVVVTGATSGIGLAIVLELARAGFDVIGTARSEPDAQAIRGKAAGDGLRIRTVLCDIADAVATATAFDEIAAMTDGGPWAVVNNAGFAQPGAIEDVDDELVRRQLEVNLVAPARITRHVLPRMRERGDGRIVNISSVAGRLGLPLLAWYCASKHGLEAMSDVLRMEVAGFGVKVVLIEPGNFASRIWERGLSILPEMEQSAYAKAYRVVMDQVQTHSGQFPPPAPVARAVRKALQSSRPRARYVVGADAITAILLESAAPTFLMDYSKRLTFGLTSQTDMSANLADRVGRRRT